MNAVQQRRVWFPIFSSALVVSLSLSGISAQDSATTEAAKTDQYSKRDADGNGQLSVGEFLNGVPQEHHNGAEANFLRSDTNADGTLNREEFEHQGEPEWFRTDPVVARLEALVRLLEPIFLSVKPADERGISEKEWPGAQIFRVNGDLASIPFAVWDRDGNGQVSADERQLVLESACGIRRSDGQPVRKPGGHVFNQIIVQSLDKNQDGNLSREEIVTGYWEGEKNAERFAEWDKDADGQLPFAELALLPWCFTDPLWEFSNYDADRDGLLTKAELLARVSNWQREVVTRLIPQFDANGDERLDPAEYLLCPLGNPTTNWFALPADRDNDGKLSREEYFAGPLPYLAVIAGDYFRRFDTDQDGRLSIREFRCQLDPLKAPFEIVYSTWDLDGDGRVSREEYVHPNLGGQWENAAKHESVVHDLDGDGILSLLEFAMTPHGNAKAEALFPILDADGNGRMSRREFLTLRPKEQWSGWGAAFERADIDRDGTLNREEFTRQGEPDRLRADPLLGRVEQWISQLETICDAADANHDGRLTQDEWPQKKLAEVADGLADLSFAEWDRNHDRAVTAAERRQALEIAYGVRWSENALLRKPGSYALYLHHLRSLDKNRDQVVSREEFVSGHNEGAARNAVVFQECDADGDGKLTIADFASLARWFGDLYYDFCMFDADFDERISTDELLARAAEWQKGMASRLVPAFDTDSDGRLSLDEFLLTPFPNPITDWYTNREDADRDGYLAWTEYYPEKSPWLFGLYRHFFKRFDRDGDGKLSSREYPFAIDLERAAPAAALASLDTDGDLKIVLPELITTSRPPAEDPAARLAWEERTMQIEEAFRAADTNHDDAVTAEEFAARQTLLGAAILGRPAAASAPTGRGTQNLAQRNQSSTWNWRMISLVLLNVLLLIGGGWLVLKPAARS